MSSSQTDKKIPSTPKAKGKFTPEEDELLMSLIGNSKTIDWPSISNQMGNKTTRQCRERWQNYLDPRLQKGGWTIEEDELLLKRYSEYSSHWNAIARTFKGRSGNSVRNRYLLLTRRMEKRNRAVYKTSTKLPMPITAINERSPINEASSNKPLFTFENNTQNAFSNLFDDIFDNILNPEIDAFGFNFF